MQAVGELDEEDADVAREGEDQLAEVLGLFGAVRLEFEAGELGDAVDQAGDLGAECLGQVVAVDSGVFDDVVQQGGGDGADVEAVAGEDFGDGEGVGGASGGVAGVGPGVGCVFRRAGDEAAGTGSGGVAG